MAEKAGEFPVFLFSDGFRNVSVAAESEADTREVLKEAQRDGDSKAEALKGWFEKAAPPRRLDASFRASARGILWDPDEP